MAQVLPQARLLLEHRPVLAPRRPGSRQRRAQ